MLSPSPPAFNLSQHQGLFKWVSSLHQVAKVLAVSASTSVLPMNTKDWSPLGWTGWIFLQSKGLSSLLQQHSLKVSILRCSALFTVQLSHPYTTTGKTTALTKRTFVGKVMSLLFNMLSRLVITILPRSKSFHFMTAVPICSDLGAQKNSLSLFPHLFAMKWWDQMPWSSFSECWALSQLFHSPLWKKVVSGKESAGQCRGRKRHGFNPWGGKIPWRKKWQPTPVFLPGEFHGYRSLAGYSPWGHKVSDMTKHWW